MKMTGPGEKISFGLVVFLGQHWNFPYLIESSIPGLPDAGASLQGGLGQSTGSGMGSLLQETNNVIRASITPQKN